MLLPQTKKDEEDYYMILINNQINTTIEHIKTSKVYGVSPDDRTNLFGYIKFDIIQSFATQDEMIDLREKVDKASGELFQHEFSTEDESMTFSKYFNRR